MIIKNIFVPEKIRGYYIFSKRIIGFDVNKTHVYATQLLLKGYTITVEKCIEVPLEAGNGINYEERAAKAISFILNQVDDYDVIHTGISSSLAVFKELRLPFLDKNKIRMVLDFEIEPLLPFPLSDAIVDFIITKQVIPEKSSEVLAAAVQKQHIEQHLSLFTQAGVSPSVITIDLFALYGAFNLITSYSDLPGGTVLVDVGAYTTGIAYIQDGQLRLIRSLPKGILTQAKVISQHLNIQAGESMENILRFGLDKTAEPHYLQAATKAFTEFWHEIALTISSFTAQTERNIVNQMLILGLGSDIKGLSSFVSSVVGIPCELFHIHKLLQNSNLHFIAKNSIPPAAVMSFCIALPTATTEEFNLLSKEFGIQRDRSLLIKQLSVGIALILLIIIALAQHSFFQIRKLTNAAQEAEDATVLLLKNQFKNIPADEQNLDTVVERARYEVQREEKLWFSFANPARVSFLQYLLELTSLINKEELGFTIDKLVITEKTISMTAHVKDHKALSILEKELRQSKLFAHVQEVDEPDFTMKIRLS